MGTKNQSLCLNCGSLFDLSFGIPVGSNHIVCSNGCAEAVLNIADRDYPGMRTDESVIKVFKDKVVAKEDKNAPKYVWAYSSSEPWSSKLFNSRNEAILDATSVAAGKTFYTGVLAKLNIEGVVPSHLAKMVSNALSEHLYEMWGDYTGTSYDFSVIDEMLVSLQERLKDTIIGWLMCKNSPDLLIVKEIQEHVAPAKAK